MDHSDSQPPAAPLSSLTLQLGVYADFENLWIENRKILFPLYDWEKGQISGRKATEDELNEMHKHMMQFIDVFCKITRVSIGVEPRWRHAFAVWSKLDRSPDRSHQAKEALERAGYHPHHPLNLPSSVAGKAGSHKDASDRELCYKVIDGIVFRRSESGLNSVLICTGDHYAARLANFLREHKDITVFVMNFSTSRSQALDDLLKDKRERLISIDKQQEYRDYLAAATGPAVLRERSNDPDEVLFRIAVYKRSATTMEYVGPHLFEKWIAGWIQHIASEFAIPFPRDAIQYRKQLEKDGMLEEKDKKLKSGEKRKSFELVTSHNRVTAAIASIKENDNAYKVKWRVPNQSST
jgi:hypothetical protein